MITESQICDPIPSASVFLNLLCNSKENVMEYINYHRRLFFIRAAFIFDPSKNTYIFENVALVEMYKGKQIGITFNRHGKRDGQDFTATLLEKEDRTMSFYFCRNTTTDAEGRMDTGRSQYSFLENKRISGSYDSDRDKRKRSVQGLLIPKLLFRSLRDNRNDLLSFTRNFCEHEGFII